MTRTLSSVVALCFFASLLAAPSLAQSGKIAGRVTDAGTGEPIPGANVIVVGTGQGDAADLDGYYTILNVSPGQVTLQVSSLGYGSQTIENVDVNIGQTTTINSALREEGLGLGDVVVRAERPPVEVDVSNSRLNVSAAEIQALPASDIQAVVGLQAGIRGLSVRGSGSDEISFQVNGLTMRDERDNSPFTSIPLSAVQEVQVQTGGFNAEYGNVRSGVINVVTKEGSTDRYEVNIQTRLSPAAQKNFGGLANAPDSYWIRPYLDPEVAMMGTDNGAWTNATRQQYPEFAGWVAVSQTLLEDDDPTNDMTPEALQQAFLWQHRKQLDITEPDYDVDLGFGGPVPFVSRSLGNLRFYSSFRQEEDMYSIPLNTDRYTERTGRLKLTSNVANGMKLSIEGMLAEQDGTSASRSGGTGFFRTPDGIESVLTSVSFIDSRIFSTDYFSPSSVSRNQVGATFTHTLSSSAFYEIRGNRYSTDYNTNPGRRRDESTAVNFGGVSFDEAPFGWQPFSIPGINGSTGVEGNLRMGVGMSNARDSSRVTNWNIRGDFTSQATRFAEFKSGLEFNLTESDVNFARIDSALTGSNQWTQWDRQPIRGAAYAQTKLELQGMIANLGLRADYYAPRGDWYVYDVFDPVFGNIPTVNGDPRPGLDSLLATEPINSQLTLSPRLGVSFPVTAVSKLFFNYGHFRALPDSDRLFRVNTNPTSTSTGRLDVIANPNSAPPKTIAYELGYEQSFFDQFVARVAGYYKDVSFQPQSITYESRQGVTYSANQPNSFEDIRGFEVTLSKNRGEWFQGFLNYTYMVYTDGYFGFQRVFENTTEQRRREEAEIAARAAAAEPVARPYARLNLDFLVPDDFGPSVGGFRPLADWRVSFIAQWRDGGKATWGDGFNPEPGIRNNVDVADYSNLDLRFAREIRVGQRNVTLFADVFNALNQRTFSGRTGFFNGSDQVRYYDSLHLPESTDYTNIVGDDVVGAYRSEDVAFEPICRQPGPGQEACAYGNTATDVIYFDEEAGVYTVFQDGEYVPADSGRVNRVLETKAYIDMPNQGFLTFLNPRDIYIGIRVNL